MDDPTWVDLRKHLSFTNIKKPAQQ